MSDDGTIPLFAKPRRAGRPRAIKAVAAFAESVRVAEHLQPADAATVEVGRRLAAELDATDDPKQIVALSGQFITVLDRLGLSPLGRHRLRLADDQVEVVNPFDAARSLLEADWGVQT